MIKTKTKLKNILLTFFLIFNFKSSNSMVYSESLLGKKIVSLIDQIIYQFKVALFCAERIDYYPSYDDTCYVDYAYCPFRELESRAQMLWIAHLLTHLNSLNKLKIKINKNKNNFSSINLFDIFNALILTQVFLEDLGFKVSTKYIKFAQKYHNKLNLLDMKIKFDEKTEREVFIKHDFFSLTRFPHLLYSDILVRDLYFLILDINKNNKVNLKKLLKFLKPTKISVDHENDLCYLYHYIVYLCNIKVNEIDTDMRQDVSKIYFNPNSTIKVPFYRFMQNLHKHTSIEFHDVSKIYKYLGLFKNIKK